MMGSVPSIPLSLAHLPTVAGLVVPWVTPQTVDGRYLFGVLHPRRVSQALWGRLCQICGLPLEHRVVLLLRLSDLGRRCTAEPGLHPHCAAYTCEACPMVSGRMTHYRSTVHQLDETMRAAHDTAARLGAPAEPWFQVWLTCYHVIVDHGNLAASYAGENPLRIRAATRWLS